MHDNGTQTIKAEVVEPIVEAQETCREEANTSSSYSPSPRTVYTCNDGKVGACPGHGALFIPLVSTSTVYTVYFISSPNRVPVYLLPTFLVVVFHGVPSLFSSLFSHYFDINFSRHKSLI